MDIIIHDISDEELLAIVRGMNGVSFDERYWTKESYSHQVDSILGECEDRTDYIFEKKGGSYILGLKYENAEGVFGRTNRMRFSMSCEGNTFSIETFVSDARYDGEEVFLSGGMNNNIHIRAI